MAEKLNLGVQGELRLILEDIVKQLATDDRKVKTEMRNESGGLEYEPEPSTSSASSSRGPCSSSASSSNLLGLSLNDDDIQNQNVQESAPEVPEPLVLVAPRLQVIRSTRFMEDIGKEIKLYRTRGLRRGVLVIFSYSKFTTGETNRDVSSDNEMLMDLFRQIGFKTVMLYEDKTKPESIELMKNLDLEGFECVFFVVSSHGYGRDGMWDTEIRCRDGGFISSHEVVDLFNSVNYPALNGIPKVFIFQACRGKKLLPELQGVLTDVSNFNGASEARGHAGERDRSYSDILIAHSTLPGFVSARIDGDNKGSWYKQALCSVFAAHAHDHHVIDLFRLVDEELQRRCPGATTTVESWGFNKDLYLHPGLAEDANGNPRPIQ